MSTNKQYFHFTLGPVQSFVAQARRTRDFWAGSFLLSWLSAVAMLSVQKQGGTISFPAADENFMRWLEGKAKDASTKPAQGSVPNRFKAEVADNFKPESVLQDVRSAWQTLAQHIFDRDLKKYKGTTETEEIWHRQINHFWDISWVLTKDEKSAALDQRKNWRSYAPPEEAGVKCMMMEGWQELSGTATPYQAHLTEFWEPLRQKMSTDLREHEYLCAIAFVKRRFVRHFKDLRIDMPSGWQLSGWELPTGVPSVAYMAGVHWLEQVIEQADESVFEAYFEEANNLTDSLGEWNSRITCLQKFKHSKPQYKQWTSLDGNVFHEFVLNNVNTYPDQEQAQKVVQALKALNRQVKEKNPKFTPASPFYAVLMMDGDSLGKHMSDLTKQTAITRGLKQFTEGVKGCVENHNGFLIYAGGDDVLALLPLEDALQCAADLRKHYLQCFKCDKTITTTLSGAIVYAHLKLPLTRVLFDAHRLLDEVAKERSGRDSIAVWVRKPSGSVIEWSHPWEEALEADQVKINLLKDQLQQAQAEDDQFSSKFFYKIREHFSLLNSVINDTEEASNSPKTSKAPHHQENKDNDRDRYEDSIDLMCMEYLNSGKTTVKTMAQAREHIKRLLEQCRQVRRDVNGKIVKESFLFADGALLVRFLAQKGIER